jgi:thiol reductant ABC exporter CydC subunit
MSDPLVRLLPLGRPVRRTLALAVLAGTATVCCGVGLFATAGWLIARAAEHPSVMALSVAVVAVRGFGIGRGVFRYGERLLTHDGALRAMADVRPRVFARLAAVAPAGLPKVRSGDLLARVVGDVDAVQDLLVRGLTPALTAVLAGCAATLFTASLSGPAAALLGLGLLAAGACLPWAVAALSRRSGPARTDARAELSAHVAGIVDGAADLLAHGAQDRALAGLAVLDRRQSCLARWEAGVAGVGAGGAVLVAGGTLWLVTRVAAGSTAAGGLDRVTLVVVVLTALASFEAVTPLPAAAAALASARRSAARLFRVLDAPDAVRAPRAAAPLPPGTPAVRLRSVSVRYAPDAPWSLDGVDLDLPPGRRVAVVGPSGSGKSTLAAVLLRFRDPDRGEVTLGGVPVQELDPEQVRRCIGGCPADPHVFASTVRENLRLARPDADDTALEAAAAEAGLLDWIRSLPDGWSTHLGARGARMSGGQRQRLALARALLADPPVMVLDEPTAHLDPGARSALTGPLLDVLRGRTTLLVTHDLQALAAVDEVLVLDAGRVVQRGTHDELVRRPGLYRQMWELDEPGAL